MRILIIAALVYIFYRALKSWMLKNSSVSGRSTPGRDASEIADVMVKDPYCQVYFPQRKGVRLRHKGQEVLFCSKECRDKFIAETKKMED